MTAPVFLHGGGGRPDAIAGTFGPFVAAARTNGDGLILLIIHSEVEVDLVEYRAILESADALASSLVSLVLMPGTALTTEQVATHQPSGIFVCGGPTPRYQEALCTDTSWVEYIHDRELPYCGTSAGVAIAAQRAIVGGWRVERGEAVTAMMYSGASEGLDLLDVRPGLGLVPWSVEVHASQSGTLSRLLYAVDAGLVDEGWAIDEDTLLTVDAGQVSIRGLGQAYHVRRSANLTLVVKILTDGETSGTDEQPPR